MGLTPWYKVAVPREDLRKKQPLDAAQFAVHLDKVASGEAPPDYADPGQFIDRTMITDGLGRFAAEVIRRLSGERQGANAVYNLVTQFGGGKTHALTLLYHLAKLGSDAMALPGVSDLLKLAEVSEIPSAAVAVFVGTDWNAVSGLGGNGEPLRRTPWGEIAFQLSQQTGDKQLFEAIAAEDEARIRPGKDIIRKFIPTDRPCLILMDEVMNFMTAARGITVGKSTLASQFYEFIHALTEEADSRDRLVVVVSLPKSEQEMSAEDESDYKRLAKVTTRVAEPYVLARDLEIPEIVRRRLFEGVGDPAEIRSTARAFAKWVQEHSALLPSWFPIDRAQETFEANYPFHPVVLSVFERKWQALPSFQRTRGILRLLAHWVADAYFEGFQGAHRDPLITLGTAPLDDQFFRTAVLDQLGDDRLSAAILSDIAGEQAHADRLDEASETLGKARLHRKVASAIFFESSGGQVRQEATVPEIRLGVGDPDLEIGNIETALEALREDAYFLIGESTGYRFSAKANLNKLLADRRAALDPSAVEEKAREQIRKVFNDKKGIVTSIDPVFFPDEPSQIENIPALRLVVLSPERAVGDETRAFVERCMKEWGAAPRVFRNALIWSIPDSASALLDAARRLKAWESLEDEAETREFDGSQRAQLTQGKERARNDLKEAVWRTYRFLSFLGLDGSLKEEDLGLVHSSAAESMQAFIQARLRQRDELTDGLAPSRIIQNWPKGLDEWSTRGLRDAVYASPAFTRVLNSEALKDSIARGVQEALFGYAAKTEGEYVGIKFEESFEPSGVEFSEDVVLVPESLARQLKEAKPSPETPVPSGQQPTVTTTTEASGAPAAVPLFTGKKIAALKWKGAVPHQKWTTFYTKVLQRLVSEGNVSLQVEFESKPPGGMFEERAQETKQGLQELGLADDVAVEETPED